MRIANPDRTDNFIYHDPNRIKYKDPETLNCPNLLADSMDSKAFRIWDELIDISDTPVKANQNKAASFTSDISDISDISDSTSSNMKMMADVTTDERNHRASDTYDLSDIYDATTGMHLNSEQESRSIFRLGHSENCKQKDDVHHMRQHLWGEIK